MANQAISRLKGDDYQHLYSWWLALELKQPWKKVRHICIEDAEAGSVDDVTVKYKLEANKSGIFYQIKYHVDQRGQYSTNILTASSNGRSSLLRKFWRSWKLLQQNNHGDIELCLVSNWTWDSSDTFFAVCVDENGAIKPIFYDGKQHPEALNSWLTHLEISPDELKEFGARLRFKIGSTGADDLKGRVAERMRNLGLRSDENALQVAVNIIREWIKAGKKNMSIEDIDDLLKRHDLLMPHNDEKFITVHLNTIIREKYELEPDHVIDLCEYFEGNGAVKGRQLLPQYDWNKHLLPFMDELKATMDSTASSRLLRVQGKARLSPWFAFGYTFRDVTGYTLEINQNGTIWRTDATRSDDFQLVLVNDLGDLTGECIDGKGSIVAVGISVTGSLDDAVREHLCERQEEVAALLLIRPEHELGRDCIRHAGDLVALADGTKDIVRTFVRKWKATKLLLYYFGPLSGACFLGHQFNAVCRDIQLMEDQQPGYAPSFLLR